MRHVKNTNTGTKIQKDAKRRNDNHRLRDGNKKRKIQKDPKKNTGIRP